VGPCSCSWLQAGVLIPVRVLDVRIAGPCGWLCGRDDLAMLCRRFDGSVAFTCMWESPGFSIRIGKGIAGGS
jgi:hypothetical protein